MRARTCPASWMMAVAFWVALPCATGTARAAEQAPRQGPADIAEVIDRLLGKHWQHEHIAPAAIADEAALIRRVTLDLAGRVPTVGEWKQLPAQDRYAAVVRKLLDGPEFSWYFATVLDDMIQGPLAGNPAFVGYLRRALRDGKRWDTMFREILVGPWDSDERKASATFLSLRVKDLDRLTADVTRSFFGVDISCARCHNHPLVKDWKREHYYGMAAFLVRTVGGGKGAVAEKADGEARFASKGGKERIIPMMFLSGRKVEEAAGASKSKVGRREKLVLLALEDRKFLSRALVNRVWEYFFGRGLVDPVDQIHSGNPASVPALLNWLADDFADSGYDIRRLVAGIVRSKAYRLDSRWTPSTPVPDAKHFAVARLRPLTPRQLAASLTIALGDGRFEPTAASLQAVEKQTAELVKHLDVRTREFQSSSGEALFLSNSEAMRKLGAADGGSLSARLAALADDRAVVRAAFDAVLGRAPTAAESERLVRWLGRSGQDRREACADLAWALAASAEFRFNH